MDSSNKINGYELVPKPSSAVEKAAPGAKRIMSVMISDVLEVVKKGRETACEVAAKNGLAEAQFNLAYHYVDSNKSEHVKWLRRAAEQGHEKAQLRLSIILWMGYLPEEQQDIVEAYKWTRVLADEPERDYEFTNLEEMKKYMTPEQIRKGEAIAREFLQKVEKQDHN